MNRVRIFCCVTATVMSLACNRDLPVPERLAPGDAVDPDRTDGARGGASELTAVENPTQPDRRASADLEAGEGLKFEGTAKFEEIANGVRIAVTVEDGPAGTKGIHIHEKGDCTNIKSESMGSHFNPAGKSHGLPNQPEQHAGDLGNIVIQENGNGRLEIVVPNVNLRAGDPMSILSRALIIHESEDKGTQPSGGSGNPIACGVIRS